MSSLVFLLLCLSLHATNARYLGVTDLETNKGFQVLDKVRDIELLESFLFFMSFLYIQKHYNHVMPFWRAVVMSIL